MNSYSPEQRVIAETCRTPALTVQSWTVLPQECLDLDWSRITFLALQHRVEGLLYDALDLAGIAEQIPATTVSTLARRARLAEARYRSFVQALTEVARRAPDLVAEMVFFKGARLAPLYASPRHRGLADFDFIISAGRDDELRRVLNDLGFREKPGRNGPTYFAQSPTADLGGGYIVFDVHLTAPPKYNRPSESMAQVWLSVAQPHSLDGVPCRRLPVDLEVLELLVHASEHALSWIHVCLDDDIRLIRHIDIELLCAQGEVDAAAIERHARQQGLIGELALGLAFQLILRGTLPAGLEPLRPYAEAVTDLVDVIALPDGRTGQMPAALADRAFRTDRSAEALRMMPPGTRDRRYWFEWHQGLVDDRRENVAEIARRAADSVRTLALAP
ncbi:nucleotidyltransferase family protein [Micromonospora sp. RP3T]|uniref:nucleotidyltransferase family protein n=1 Tax=Micromonospora sp. RP3T TaxID=2135446 RepID=UPI003D75FF36